LQSLEEIIHERDEDPLEIEATVEVDNPSLVCIVCLPARDEVDAMAGMMLAQLVEIPGCVVQAVTVPAAPRELLKVVEQRKPDVVYISAMAPAAVTHARTLCKRLQIRFPETHLVVGLWNARGDLSKARTRIGGGDTTHVVATLGEAQRLACLLTETMLPPPQEEPQADSGAAVLEESPV
jgi:hypothetical protein